MNNGHKLKTAAIFPLAVSSFMVVLLALGWLILHNVQSKNSLSIYDYIILNTILVIITLLLINWLMLLSFKSFNRQLKRVKWLLFFVYYPIGRFISWLLFIRKIDYQTSFLLFQNKLFYPNFKLNKPRLLILLPHCLQYHDCRIRITRDIEDCEECGKCNIGELKQLGRQNNLTIGIANGGTLARKLIHDGNPDAIIAVACHRDLTEGVRESWKYPVYAILNERPNGPCFDTKVSITELENALKKIQIQR
jgi:uncharacterized protein